MPQCFILLEAVVNRSVFLLMDLESALLSGMVGIQWHLKWLTIKHS